MADNVCKVALLTGATGFVGSHLANSLIMNEWTVHCIVRRESITHALHPSVQKHIHDGTTESLIQIMDKTRPDVVFHLASYFVAEHKPEDVVPLVQSNLLFSTQLLEAMYQCGVKSMVNTGTSWQHFKDQDENPVCLYAASKRAFEAMIKFYTETSNLSVITLKLFDTYGPMDNRPKLFRLLREAARSGNCLTMSPGEQLLDLVYIDDVVNAFLLAAEEVQHRPSHTLEQYAVSSSRYTSLRNLVSMYSEILGRPITVNWGERSYRRREVMVPWGNGTTLPGWEPRFSLEEGIRKMELEI